jgi:hypothetical protein
MKQFKKKKRLEEELDCPDIKECGFEKASGLLYSCENGEYTDCSIYLSNIDKKTKKKEEIDVDYTNPDWFIDRERRLYEEWLEQPLTFYERMENLGRVFKWKMKHRIFINWIHELPILFRRWYHRKRMAENWVKYMEGVSRCHERAWRKEEAVVEEEFKVRMIYEDREMREQMRREAVVEEEFGIRIIYKGRKK